MNEATEPQTEAPVELTPDEIQAFHDLSAMEESNDQSMAAFMDQYRRELARINYERRACWEALAESRGLDLKNKIYRLNIETGMVEYVEDKED